MKTTLWSYLCSLKSLSRSCGRRPTSYHGKFWNSVFPVYFKNDQSYDLVWCLKGKSCGSCHFMTSFWLTKIKKHPWDKTSKRNHVYTFSSFEEKIHIQELIDSMKVQKETNMSFITFTYFYFLLKKRNQHDLSFKRSLYELSELSF